MTTGWQCPGCSRCYASDVVQCAYCGPVREGVTSDGTGVVPWVVPTTFDPSPCLHLNKEQTSVGERCLACGQYIPVYVWATMKGAGVTNEFGTFTATGET